MLARYGLRLFFADLVFFFERLNEQRNQLVICHLLVARLILGDGLRQHDLHILRYNTNVGVRELLVSLGPFCLPQLLIGFRSGPAEIVCSMCRVK